MSFATRAPLRAEQDEEWGQINPRVHIVKGMQPQANFKQQQDTTTHLCESPKSRALRSPKAGEDVEQEEGAPTAGASSEGTTSKWHGHWGELGARLQSQTHSSLQSSNVHVGSSPKELKTHVPMKACTRMFRDALFKTAKTWEQPNVFQEVSG